MRSKLFCDKEQTKKLLAHLYTHRNTLQVKPFGRKRENFEIKKEFDLTLDFIKKFF
jgi:hypothetical protein